MQKAWLGEEWGSPGNQSINQSINQSFAVAPPSDVQGRLTVKIANEKCSE